MLEQILSQLFQGQNLSTAQSNQLFTAIIQGELAPEQLAACLIALKLKGETPSEIQGAVEALTAHALAFPSPDYPFVDIVGTGGDGANTINISTTSAIVAASLGYKVAKHGSRSVSSKTGASDLLSHLGVPVDLSPEQARASLDNNNLCFLFAPLYHQGFKHAAPVRQSLKTRTIFNILGPLINPARPKRQLLGVYSPELVPVYAQTVAQLGHEHAIIVHGSGLDEVALHGPTQVAEVKNGQIYYYSLTPEDFGLVEQPLEALRGGEPQENAQAISQLLQGQGAKAHAYAVAANTALLLKLFGEDDLKANAQKVLNALEAGTAYTTLVNLRNTPKEA